MEGLGWDYLEETEYLLKSGYSHILKNMAEGHVILFLRNIHIALTNNRKSGKNSEK
jgi:hypothetical protein